MKRVSYTKESIGYYTDLYRLIGGKNIKDKDRYIAYNDILFENIDTLSNKEKQIIIINELGDGGVLFGSSEFANLALKKLMDALDSQDKHIKTINSMDNGTHKKISFIIENKKNLYPRDSSN